MRLIEPACHSSYQIG